MCLVLPPNLHCQLMAATLIMTLGRLQTLLALVRLPCSEPPRCFSLTSLSTEMFFSLSALGRDLSCYPSQSMSVNFPCATGPLHKCTSVGGGACQHRQLCRSQQSAQIHSSLRRLAPQQGISLAESPASRRRKKKLHHSNLTGRAGGRSAYSEQAFYF